MVLPFEMARVALRSVRWGSSHRRGIAKKIFELPLAGERDAKFFATGCLSIFETKPGTLKDTSGEWYRPETRRGCARALLFSKISAAVVLVRGARTLGSPWTAGFGIFLTGRSNCGAERVVQPNHKSGGDSHGPTRSDDWKAIDRERPSGRHERL